MPYTLNDKISGLIPYEPISGDYRIRLDANESYIQIDSTLVAEALNQPFNRYPDPYAVKLCKAFSKLYGVSVDCITVGNGSDELISLIVGAFFTNDDTMLTLSNDFSMYKFYGDVYGVKQMTFPKEADLTINIDKLIAFVADNNIKGVIFSNPCNPTSLVETRSEIIRLVKSTDALVIVDEAYMDFSDQSIIDVCREYDNCIVLKTCSKAIGLASIRVGFAVSNKAITKALGAVKSPYNVNAISQAIAERVLSSREYVKRCVEDIVHNKEYLYRQLIKLKAKHEGIVHIYKSNTNFIFMQMSNAKQVYEDLLKHSIAVRHMGEHLRISTGNREENDVLIKVLEEILN